MLSLTQSIYMNKLIRIAMALMLVPSFIFMASVCCPSAEASSRPTSQAVLQNAPHSCCPEGKCADKSTFIDKDEAIQNQNFQVSDSNFKISVAYLAAEFQASPSNFCAFHNAFPLLKTDPVKLSSVQLLI